MSEAIARFAAFLQLSDIFLARAEREFAFRHLPGAVLVSLELLRAGIPSSIAKARDKPVVVYCNQGLERGQEATRLLQQAGFTQTVNMRSGIEGWAAAGLPIKSG
jgi:rhodanese-related sulfurtransferase